MTHLPEHRGRQGRGKLLKKKVLSLRSSVVAPPPLAVMQMTALLSLSCQILTTRMSSLVHWLNLCQDRATKWCCSPSELSMASRFLCCRHCQIFWCLPNQQQHPLENIFYHHFPNIPFRRSTVNENCARWKKAPQLVRDNVLRAKYTPEGKWSVFQMKTRKGGKVLGHLWLLC
jgi:hypothetical protein